jgi:3-methyladenine DNA glycosylase AlkC
MAEPFKNLINAELVSALALHLQRQGKRLHSGFDARGFVADATRGLEALEMKARSMLIADALQRHLPADFGAAAALIEAALAPPFTHDRLSEMRITDAGLAGWSLWPMGEFVVRAGMHEPERALELLRQITQRFSAEFAIRPFIAAHPPLAFATLERWARDPNVHVRRLVSEGSRPRLPWGMQLKALIADPAPTLPLLKALQDDEAEYVRRSVANHLNDIAKDHPALLVRWLGEHLPGAGAARRALLKHASRTLIKKGDAKTLAAWGLGARFRGEAELTVKPTRVAVGGEVTLTLTLRSRAKSSQALAIDYAVHHVKADGTTSPKVFKGWELALAAGAETALTKRHSLKPVTTRSYYAGRHRVVVQVNGNEVAEASFNLRGG